MTGSPCLTMWNVLQMSQPHVSENFRTVSPLYSAPVFEGHPHREQWHAVGKKFKQRFHLPDDYDNDGQDDYEQRYPRYPSGSCRVQAVRSVSDWSHGVLTEHSIQDACESFINLACRGD